MTGAISSDDIVAGPCAGCTLLLAAVHPRHCQPESSAAPPAASADSCSRRPPQLAWLHTHTGQPHHHHPPLPSPLPPLPSQPAHPSFARHLPRQPPIVPNCPS